MFFNSYPWIVEKIQKPGTELASIKKNPTKMQKKNNFGNVWECHFWKFWISNDAAWYSGNVADRGIKIKGFYILFDLVGSRARLDLARLKICNPSIPSSTSPIRLRPTSFEPQFNFEQLLLHLNSFTLLIFFE